MKNDITIIPTQVENDLQEIATTLAKAMEANQVTPYRFKVLGVREERIKPVLAANGGTLSTAASMANALGMKITLVKQTKDNADI